MSRFAQRTLVGDNRAVTGLGKAPAAGIGVVDGYGVATVGVSGEVALLAGVDVDLSVSVDTKPVQEAAVDVAETTVDVAKDVADTTQKAAEQTVSTVTDVAKDTGKAVSKTADDVGKGASKAAKDTGKAMKKAFKF